MLRFVSHLAWGLLIVTSATLPKAAWSQVYRWEPLLFEEPPADREARTGVAVRRPGLEGYRRTSAVVVLPEYILPPPANPNMLFGNEPSDPPGTAGFRGGLPFKVAANAKVRVDAAYDTGFVGSGIELLPSTIALDGTAAARRRGRTLISPNATQLAVGIDAPGRRFRADVELEFINGVNVRQLRGQAADLLWGGTLWGGATWTTFMDEFAVPISIVANTTSAGAVFRRQPQLGYSVPIGGGWRTMLAIEQGPNTDFTLIDSVNDLRLQRSPDLVARLHYASSYDTTTNSTFHLATLVRGIGYEDVTYNEEFVTGWGVSVMGKIRPWGRDALYIGFVGGEGIGSYIFGFAPASGPTPLDNMPAAGPDAGRLRTLSNVGSHIGYTRVWHPGSSMTNFGYGYAFADTTADMPATAARKLQNAWVNHQWRVNESVALGVEYHYAVREVRDHTEGDNHRVMFVAQFLN